MFLIQTDKIQQSEEAEKRRWVTLAWVGAAAMSRGVLSIAISFGLKGIGVIQIWVLGKRGIFLNGGGGGVC